MTQENLMRRSLGTKQQKEIKKASMLLLLLFSLILASLMGILMYHFNAGINIGNGGKKILRVFDAVFHIVQL